MQEIAKGKGDTREIAPKQGEIQVKKRDKKQKREEGEQIFKKSHLHRKKDWRLCKISGQVRELVREVRQTV